MLKNRESLVGQVFSTKQYGDVTVVRYYNNQHLTVEFQQTGTLCSARLANLHKGKLADPFAERKAKLIRGNGYPGIGKFRQVSHTDAYDLWSNMLNRCYNPDMRKNTESYKGCTVCEEWLNFQNFADWYYKQIREPGYSLDKDILLKGNRLYHPDRCAMIPPNINILFASRKAGRGQYPIGVYYAKDCTRNPFTARCSDGTGRSVYLGAFPSQAEAFHAYKAYKENLIKQKADEYRERMDPRVYEAMMKYEVEITD